MVVLKRAIVSEQYYCTLDQDVVIHIGCFSGNISNINECGAAALVKSKFDGFYAKPPEADETFVNEANGTSDQASPDAMVASSEKEADLSSE